MEINNTNLRLTDGLYAPVGKTFIHRPLKGYSPAGRLGGELFSHKGSELRLGSESQDAGSEIRCTYLRNENEAIVMTAGGPLLARAVDGRLSVVKAEAPPSVRLVATAGSPVTASVDKRTLSSNLSDRHLKESDSKALTNDLCTAYRQLCETAAGSGSSLQPALARYRLVDNEGRCIFTSPTVFLSHSSGSQCAGYTELYLHEGSTLQGYTLEARPWWLDIVLPDVARDDISRLEVTMTPLFHPYDTSMHANIFMGLRSNAGDPVARIALPGASRSTNETYGQSIIREAFARMDELERPVISIQHPFNGTARTVRAALAASTDPMADTNAIRNALTKHIAPADRIETLLSAPNSISASIVADNGTTLLWSGLRVLRASACSPDIFASGKGESMTWGATIAVRFRGNKGVTSTYLGGTGGFHTLGPILSYPSADAEEIGISVNCGGRFYRGSFPLTPDSSGRQALYMAPGLKAIELEEDKNPLFFSYDDASETLPGYAVFTEPSLPLEIKGYCSLGAECMGVVSRKAQNQAWDFGRSRFIAATTDAILSLSLSRGGEVSVNKLSDEGIGRKDAIVCKDNGDICIIQHGGIYILKSSGGLSAFETNGNYEALAWNGMRSELWALTVDGDSIVFGKDYRFRRNDIVPTSFVNTGGEAFGVCSEGMSVLAEEAAGPCDISFARYFDVAGYPSSTKKGDKRRPNVRALSINIQGGDVNGSVHVSAVSLDGKRTHAIRTIKISGSCTGPVQIPLFVRLHRRLKLNFSGRVSADFRLKAE